MPVSGRKSKSGIDARRVVCWPAIISILLIGAKNLTAAAGLIEIDREHNWAWLSEGSGQLKLRLCFDRHCVLDRCSVYGREVLSNAAGVFTGIYSSNHWFTSLSNIPNLNVASTSNSLTVSGIRFGTGELAVDETWRFKVESNTIVWRIDRNYSRAAQLEDAGFPCWEFDSLSTWTGALLGNGGVAWFKLMGVTNASYGVHNGTFTLWEKDQPGCLRVESRSLTGDKLAVKFSHRPEGALSLTSYATRDEVVPKHGLSRFLRDRTDVWQPFAIQPGTLSAEFTLSALDYPRQYDRGQLRGVDGEAVREICHTIARIGVIDELVIGSNGYYSDCAVLHEPWLAQLGIAIADDDYCRALSDTLDSQRRLAIEPEGRVKPRWAGHPGDESAGTYDSAGYYECQWGWLMDSQTSWVINVAELFDLTGDQPWLQRQKSAGERTLDYLLKTDVNASGLVKARTKSHREGKGSDWLDVVWASYENALINAQMYWALCSWGEVEELLHDRNQAIRYRDAARKLKSRFNQSVAEGGFWDEQNQCYVHWREPDGSAHGTNFVLPVNFSAIGYGLCEDSVRRAAILERLEVRMKQERLFCWPACLDSYAREEVHPEVNWPFPRYENGDLFLAWGELGTRAYSPTQPETALKYINHVLTQYRRDGLAFQRYLRHSQAGSGDDILANNCSMIVGLYRNVFGIQPRHNRLYLEPHLPREVEGTRLKYHLRGKNYDILLNRGDYTVSNSSGSLRCGDAFGLDLRAGQISFFAGTNRVAALVASSTNSSVIQLDMRGWSEGSTRPRRWRQTVLGSASKLVIHYEVVGLAPNINYQLSCNGKAIEVIQTDANGRLSFLSSGPENGSGTSEFLLMPSFIH